MSGSVAAWRNISRRAQADSQTKHLQDSEAANVALRRELDGQRQQASENRAAATELQGTVDSLYAELEDSRAQTAVQMESFQALDEANETIERLQQQLLDQSRSRSVVMPVMFILD